MRREPNGSVQLVSPGARNGSAGGARARRTRTGRRARRELEPERTEHVARAHIAARCMDNVDQAVDRQRVLRLVDDVPDRVRTRIGRADLRRARTPLRERDPVVDRLSAEAPVAPTRPTAARANATITSIVTLTVPPVSRINLRIATRLPNRIDNRIRTKKQPTLTPGPKPDARTPFPPRHSSNSFLAPVGSDNPTPPNRGTCYENNCSERWLPDR